MLKKVSMFLQPKWETVDDIIVYDGASSNGTS